MDYYATSILVTIRDGKKIVKLNTRGFRLEQVENYPLNQVSGTGSGGNFIRGGYG